MGKIYGSKKDYLIVDGALPNAEESNSDKMVEVRGTGVNARVYWVTDNLFNDWV
jgi:Radial spokehead-like protein